MLNQVCGLNMLKTLHRTFRAFLSFDFPNFQELSRDHLNHIEEIKLLNKIF